MELMKLFGVYRIGEPKPIGVYSDEGLALKVCYTLNRLSLAGWAYIVEPIKED